MLPCNSIYFGTPPWLHEPNYVDCWILGPLQTPVPIWQLGMECDPIEISRCFCCVGWLRREKMSENCKWVNTVDDAAQCHAIDLCSMQWTCQGTECFTGQGCRHRGQGSGSTSATNSVIWAAHYLFYTFFNVEPQCLLVWS